MAFRLRALAGLVLVPLLASCATTPPAQPPSSAPLPAGVSEPAEPPAVSVESMESATTPEPLPTIPDTLPNEVVRTPFDGGDATSPEVQRQFSGQPISVHVLCASYDGEVEVRLLVDGEVDTAAMNPCTEPHFIVENASFEAGAHRVVLEVAASGGASGVAYVLEGDI